MQIKIEIDVRPEELRRFLGLPDVAGLQEDVIHFLRTKVGQASENFDASAFVKGNIDLLSRNATVRKLLSAVKHTEVGAKDGATTAKGKTSKAGRTAEQTASAQDKAKVRDKVRAKNRDRNRDHGDGTKAASGGGKAKAKRPVATRQSTGDTKNQPMTSPFKEVLLPKAARQGSELGADLSAAVSMAEDALKRGGNRLKMAALKGIPKGLPASAMKIAGKATSKSPVTKANPPLSDTGSVDRKAQDPSSQGAKTPGPSADKPQK